MLDSVTGRQRRGALSTQHTQRTERRQLGREACAQEAVRPREGAEARQLLASRPQGAVHAQAGLSGFLCLVGSTVTHQRQCPLGRDVVH